MRENFPFPVVLAKAGTHKAYGRFSALWIPAFAGTTGKENFFSISDIRPQETGRYRRIFVGKSQRLRVKGVPPPYATVVAMLSYRP
jgi:hypothetical protein